ncbi:aminomethyl transferase family protein [Brevibacterium casei]
MSANSLKDELSAGSGVVATLKNSPYRPMVFPVAAEFTNWRSEQHAWRDSVALLDQSHHMTDLFISGPDAAALLEHLAVNSFKNFGVDKAKQMVSVNADGKFIGDAILFHLEDELYDLVGHPMLIDWVHFNAETGDWNVTIDRDPTSADRQGPPKLYRFEIQGPNAVKVMEKVTGQPVPDVKFFNMATFTIAGHEVKALKHGMAGQPGFEMFGPWAEGEDVLAALLEAGKDFDLKRAGAKAYSTANIESGWVPTPLPAIFTSEDTAAYREWVPFGRIGSLGGSYDAESIEDYYLTPYDLGYGRTVKFDHDFVGREALEKIAEGPHRVKVTLVWNPEDVAGAFGSLMGEELPAKFIELPKSRYAHHQYDKVTVDGSTVGMSLDCGYVANPQAYISLAVVDAEYAQPGTEVTVVWGENPNTDKPAIEPHRQISIRATVAPVPFDVHARESYRA